MNKLDREAVAAFIDDCLRQYHQTMLDRLMDLKLQGILKRKNPYLFKAKSLDIAHDLVKALLDAYLSSREETLFGGLLEQVAIFICGRVFEGRKSSTEGIDLEFEKDDTRYLVSIKSGPNWGNSSQIAKMKDHFRKARRILRTNINPHRIVFVNGCCYGKDDRPEKGAYLKLCGQRFWELISSDSDLYTDIIKPLGRHAKKRNEEFHEEYAKVINKFTDEFIEDFCDDSGTIDWHELVKFNSGKKD